MKKIHEQLFITRDYLKGTLKNMEILKTQCIGFKTYEPFLQNMKRHEKLCKLVDKLRKDEKLQMSWLQNDIDTVVTLLYSTKYKLVNLQ